MTTSSFRLRNADGTSTVYRVHDSGLSNSSSASSILLSSLPPEVLLGGSAGRSSIHHYGRHPGSSVSSISMDTATSLYSAHGTPPHSQSPMVILKPTKKRRKSNICANRCNKSNNPLCITFGVILSLLIIVGYVSLIVVLIPGSTKNRWNEDDVISSTVTAESSAGNQNDSWQQQQQQQVTSKQKSLQNGVSTGQDTSPMIAKSSPTAVIDGVVLPRGHSYNAIVTILDPADDPQPNDRSTELLQRAADHRVSQKSDNAGEPVRRLRRRKRRQKKKLV